MTPVAREGVLEGARSLSGVLHVPGDKSISHRAVLFGAIAAGRTDIEGFLPAADPLSTIACLRALGVQIDQDGERVVVHGAGLSGLREPEAPLDCGNSGTTMRLLAGLLAGQPFFSVLTGDASLRARPMARIAEPLRRMGAAVLGRDDGRLAPLAIRGGGLRGIIHTSPVSSAQVKSALLLAGLFADGETVVVEPGASRDHTERLLTAMGAPVVSEATAVRVRRPPAELRPLQLRIPGDFSAAAFWLVAATCIEGSELRISGVGVNPTRTGALDVLRVMGADIAVVDERTVGGEPVADLVVRSAGLTATEVGGDLVPRLIDELPALALAATQAQGTTVFRDAAELRVKESDRIATTVGELRRLGADLAATDDGMIVRGRPGPLRGGACDSHGDHRLAMTLAIAGLLSAERTTIAGAESVAVSYPGFWQQLDELTGRTLG